MAAPDTPGRVGEKRAENDLQKTISWYRFHHVCIIQHFLGGVKVFETIDKAFDKTLQQR
jgi:hypothetical protein